MTALDTQITHQLQQAVAQEIPRIFGEDTVLAPIPPVRLDRRYSFMFRFWLKRQSGQTSPILIKIPHESWMESIHEALSSEHIGDVIQGEYDGMAMIADAIAEAGNPALFAIRPRAVLKAFHALLMEEYPIRMLKTTLTKPAILSGVGKAWQEFETHLVHAGEWLRVIHDRYASGQTATLKSQKMDEIIETELAALEGTLHQSLDSLRRHFLDLFNALREENIPLTCLHNDFHLGNIFVTQDGKIGVLDPNWLEGGSIYTDLATLLIDPVSRKAQVISQGLTFRPALRRQFEQAVITGYFGNASLNDPLLDFYCAAALLAKWRADEELLASGDSNQSRAVSFVAGPLIRSYFHRLILGYLQR